MDASYNQIVAKAPRELKGIAGAEEWPYAVWFDIIVTNRTRCDLDIRRVIEVLLGEAAHH